eukprot:180654-Prymnesium_polylepis.3
MKAAIDSLPPKLLVLSSHSPTLAVKFKSFDLDLENRVSLNVARIQQARSPILYQMRTHSLWLRVLTHQSTRKPWRHKLETTPVQCLARICFTSVSRTSHFAQATFTGKGDKDKVPSIYKDYVERITDVLMQTFAVVDQNDFAAEHDFPPKPAVALPARQEKLLLAEGLPVLLLPETENRALGGEGATQLGMVTADGKLTVVQNGNEAHNAETLSLDASSQVVLPWRPPPGDWEATFWQH